MRSDEPDARTRPACNRRRLARLLLLAPFAALLAVPLYAREEPALLGWPFFYWYQFAWAVIAIALMAAVVHLTPAGADDDASEPPQPPDPTR